MSDPVEIVAREIVVGFTGMPAEFIEIERARQHAIGILSAVHAAGWRIVRTTSTPAWDEEGFARVTEEWTP